MVVQRLVTELTYLGSLLCLPKPTVICDQQALIKTYRLSTGLRPTVHTKNARTVEDTRPKFSDVAVKGTDLKVANGRE